MSPYVIKKRKIRIRVEDDTERQTRPPGKVRRALLQISLALLVTIAAGVSFFWYTGQVIPPYKGSGSAWSAQWRPLFQGIEYTQGVINDPRPMKIHVLRVDLQAPGVEIVVTPPIAAPSDGAEAVTQTTSAFLEKTKCQVAVNATLYNPVVKFSGKPVDILGLSVSGGEKYSEAASNLHAVGWTEDRVTHYARPDFEDGVDIVNGVGGMWMFVVDGEVQPADSESPLPRTMVGTSRDGQYLFLAVIDGRQPGYSEGALSPEAARLMVEVGAWNVLNLDGGGSSTMAVRNSLGRGVVVNRPCSPIIPGLQRPVANHLGIRAQPLSGN